VKKKKSSSNLLLVGVGSPLVLLFLYALSCLFRKCQVLIEFIHGTCILNSTKYTKHGTGAVTYLL